MQRVQDLWSGLKSKAKAPAFQLPLVHSFRTAGTQFPILEGRLQTDQWLTTSSPEGADLAIQIGIASLTGRRAKNEDTALVFLSQINDDESTLPVCFAVVADGMGGQWGGEFASSIAAETLAECVISRVIMPEGLEPRRFPGESTIRDALIEGITSAHEMVQFNVPGGGTTATCALIIGDQAFFAHVGDSRAYLMSEGQLQLVTRDHSFVQMLEEQGILTSEQAKQHSQRNFLSRAIGMEGNIEADSLTQWLDPSSLVLLCSDGLWKALDIQEITRTIVEFGDPQTACENLVAAAAEADGSDNVTAIIVQMSD